MSDAAKSNEPHEGQDGAVNDVNDPEVQSDTDSGGAPEEPDTNPSVYDGGA